MRANCSSPSAFFDSLLSFSFVVASISVSPETVFFHLCFEEMSVSFCLSPPLKRFPSYPSNLFWPFWGSAVQTLLGTKRCPAFSCKQEGVTVASQIFPLPCVLTVTWNLPSVGRRLWQTCSSLPLRQCLSVPSAFSCWLVNYGMGYEGAKKNCVMVSCYLQGCGECCSNSNSPEGCRTSRGLKWQSSWAGTSIPGHFPALPFSCKWTATEALREEERAQEDTTFRLVIKLFITPG